jgi:uncharacterized protein
VPIASADREALLQSLEARDLWRQLTGVLEDYGPTLVAFSGGIDSTLVAVVAQQVLGEKSLAVTGVSASLAAREEAAAVKLAASLGLHHRLLETHEMTSSGYQANQGDRCYFCKGELFTRLGELARNEGYRTIATGDNRSDLGGHRPGLQAASEKGVRHPLIEAGFTKEAIRLLARELGIPNHAKPAAPCLASRVPDGIRVTPEILQRIESAEAGVARLGFPVFRVRHHGDLARIELPEGDLERALRFRQELTQVCKEAGYRWVSLDLQGYRSGSLSSSVPSPEAIILPEE